MDGADIFLIAILVIFIGYFAKTIYDSDMAIRETESMLKKVDNTQTEKKYCSNRR